MSFYDKTPIEVANYFSTGLKKGLSSKALEQNVKKYGYNKLIQKKEDGFFKRLFTCLKEPLIIILIFSLIIAFGSNIGSLLKGGESDFTECFGILFAVVLSVSITMIMEGSSKKAFDALSKIYDNAVVKVIRGGEVILVNQQYVTVGDIVLLESGDKIIADGRLIESNSLSVDESALTGESTSSNKNSEAVLSSGVALAERVNFVYSGTFVLGGNGKMIVTAVGNQTEIGKIAGELTKKNEEQSPLQYKLARLGKTITIIGCALAGLIFGLSIFRLIYTNNLTFAGVRGLFISCIVLIVAAVPEGLPTIVAISLALNMIKLAKENALIKKMIATETAGAVSVICSDKTGTLTQNKMTVVSVCDSEFCTSPEKNLKESLVQNFALNSSAEQVSVGKTIKFRGSGTECALLDAVKGYYKKFDLNAYREKNEKIFVLPFSSQIKHMVSVIKYGDNYRVLIKGAPEVVLSKCALNQEQKGRIISAISEKQKDGKRVICFGHYDEQVWNGNIDKSFIYDGYVCIADPLRPETKKAVKDCKNAGIQVKILTGDNLITAVSIAKELGVIDNPSQAVNASDIENLDDESFLKAIKRISVIARSTPIIKLRVVKALKKAGEVVAVTGDGINDAPAIKHADIGVAMGKSGSEITKESADVVLLDDSFATVVKTISFGRNVFKNIQRFILFQLSVNVSALLFITICALVGVETPFNTMQLLWINLIMDGPPALTLGLEKPKDSLMKAKPISKTQSIVSVKMLFRILFNGIFIGGIMLLQHFKNFLGAKTSLEAKSATFTLFIFFQLFNAFNSRELGNKSIFSSLSKNKVMAYAFLGTGLLHFIIVQFGYVSYGGAPMSIGLWLKCIIVAFSIVAVSETYKLAYRIIIEKNFLKVGAQKERKINKKIFGA